MPANLRGTNIPQRQRLSKRWSPVNGYSEEAEYRGFSETQMDALAYQWEQNGYEYELTNTLGVFTLRGVDTTGSETIDTWEIAMNKMSPSLLQNPVTLASVASGGGVYADNLKALTQHAKGEITEEKAKELLASNAPGLRILDRMVKGGDSYLRDSYVLRHTTNVQNRYTSNVSDTNVGCIYTTSQLLSETTNAGYWSFPLPGRLSYKIQVIETDYLFLYGVPDFHTVGWLKSGSSENTAANTRVNITTEYEFDAWSEDVYFLV